MSQNFNAFINQTAPYSSKVYNTNQTHPLIQSAQEYVYYKKYVSIHSEDRNALKYPNASDFEIELPQDMINVLSISLANWSFPANYDTFSPANSNVTMSFQINNPFNPESIPGPVNNLDYYTAIYDALYVLQESQYTVIIEPGFYTPTQMITELTNKFNFAVTQQITSFLQDVSGSYYNPLTYPEILAQFTSSGGYRNFVIVYNSVKQKIWFGNTTDGFILTNESQVCLNNLSDNLFCGAKAKIPSFSNWGLPGYLGLPRINYNSINGITVQEIPGFVFTGINSESLGLYNGIIVPRFYYDIVGPNEGYWLLPNNDLPGSQVYWVESPYKINLMGPSYFYMEIAGQNCIDETSPFNVSEFTEKTNETNGIANSSFAKIAIPTAPNSQWFDRDSLPYKEYTPPAERIRKIKIKMRYHNGQIVDFGISDYSILLEFVMLQPTPARSYSITYPGVRTPNSR